MDFADYFTWFVLCLDATALIIALGWYLAESGRRKVPYRRSLSSDRRLFDPHVLINGRWVPRERLRRPVPAPAWFGPRRFDFSGSADSDFR
jgi:hypothetical protein